MLSQMSNLETSPTYYDPTNFIVELEFVRNHVEQLIKTDKVQETLDSSFVEFYDELKSHIDEILDDFVDNNFNYYTDKQITRIVNAIYTLVKLYNFNLSKLNQTNPSEFIISDFEKCFRCCNTILNSKNKDYSAKSNKLAQFDNLAIRLDQTPLLVWSIFFTKGYDAITKYCLDDQELNDEDITHRIFDGINYLIILLGIINRDINNNA